MKSLMIKNIFVMLILFFTAVSGYALPGDLTNKAIHSWQNTNLSRTWFGTNFAATNFFKFSVTSLGYDPDNRYPRPGETNTIHIPFTIQNVGSLNATSIRLFPFFTNGGAVVTVTADSNTQGVFESVDNSPITKISNLASGVPYYFWLNIKVSTNMAQGVYPFFVTNLSMTPSFPLKVIYSNALDFRLQNITVYSAYEGIHSVKNFDGTGILGNLDVFVDMAFQNPPSHPVLLYDVDGIPDGLAPNGTVARNRLSTITLKANNIWQAKIPVSDPEIKDGKKVNFIIRESGRNYFFGTDPYSYFVKYFSSQLDDSKEPVIIANNVGNFAVTSVKLIFTVKRDSFVNVTVYNLRGEVIRILKNEVMKAGKYVEAWDGRNPSGREVAAGIYFIHVTTSEYGVTKKTLFVKQ